MFQKKKQGGGGYLVIESHLICSSIKSCMKTKVDIGCFILNSVFLTGPKDEDCAEEKGVHGLPFFFQFDPQFFSSFSSPFYHASSMPSHLGYAHLV